MKIKAKQILSILLVISVITVTTNTSYAFGKKKTKAAKTQNIELKTENTEYTNEKHSVFTLQDCVNIAVQYNPSIRSAVYNEEAYKTKIGQAWANFFPTIDAGVNIVRSGNTYSKEIYPGYKSMYQTAGYVPNVYADMLIFDFGKTKATADSAKRSYEAAQADTKENINTIIYDIKSTYYNILFAQAQVRVYEDTVADYQLQLSQAWGFYRLGKKAKIDVVTAEYNLGKAQLNLVKAKNVLEVARVRLSKIMGIPEYTNYELCDELSLKSYNDTVENAIATAFDVRPELISAKKSMEAAKMNLRAMRREFTPNLGVFGGYGYNVGNQYNTQSTQFGLELNYTNLNIALVKKQIDQAKAQYKKAQADYDDTKDSVYLNVKENYIDVQTAKEAIVIAKLALDQAKEQYRQVTGRYKAGVGDAIELKDGENTYLNARLDFYNAVLNYNTAAASLEKEIGVPIVFADEYILELKPEDL